jgi:cytoskeleton protein RodZ
MNKTETEIEIETAASLGKALQNARLQASLTIESVATQLNLGISTVGEIENNLVELITNQQIPIIYLRGYLVNYAKLVNLKNLNEFSEFQQLSSGQYKSKVRFSSQTPIRSSKHYGQKLFLLLIVLTVISGIGFGIQRLVASESHIFETISDLLDFDTPSFSTGTVQPIDLKDKIPTTDAEE